MGAAWNSGRLSDCNSIPLANAGYSDRRQQCAAVFGCLAWLVCLSPIAPSTPTHRMSEIKTLETPNQSLETPEKPLTTGEWFVTLLVLALPIVGLVMYFVWGFGTGNVSRRNFCRAALLWLAVGMGLAFLAFIAFLIFGGTLAALLSQRAPR